MVTLCKLFKTSLAKNGTLPHRGAEVFLLPACLLSAVYITVVSSTKDLAGLKMPLSIVHPLKDYLTCSKKEKKKPTNHQKTPLRLCSWYHILD